MKYDKFEELIADGILEVDSNENDLNVANDRHRFKRVTIYKPNGILIPIQV